MKLANPKVGLSAIAVAAAVVVGLVVGINLLPRGGELASATGTPTATSTPSATSTPMPTATPGAPPPTPTAGGTPLLKSGSIAPGTYVVYPFSGTNESIGVTFTVPDGWQTAVAPDGRITAIWPSIGFSAPNGMSLGFLTVRTLERDPCRWSDVPSRDVSAGTTVEDLRDALTEHPGYVATATETVLGGRTAWRVDVELPADLNIADCWDGQFWIWGEGAVGSSIYAQGPGAKFHFWIGYAEGKRVVVQVHDLPGTPPELVAEAEAIVNSILFEP